MLPSGTTVWAFYDGEPEAARDAAAQAIFRQFNAKPFAHGRWGEERDIAFRLRDTDALKAAGALAKAGFRAKVGGGLW